MMVAWSNVVVVEVLKMFRLANVSKLEVTRFSDVLNMWCKTKRGIKDFIVF